MRMPNETQTMNQLDDQELIGRSQRGNSQAFGILVNRYMQRAYYVALGFVGSHEDALDLSQEAFVRAYRHIKRFEKGRKFFTWYYQILRNLCFNFLKKRKKRAYLFSEIPEEEVLQFRAAAENSPDVDLEKKELKRRLWKAISALSELDREVIILREFQELSYQEMAEVLDCPVGTVMSRLYNARKHLAQYLREEGWEK